MPLVTLCLFVSCFGLLNGSLQTHNGSLVVSKGNGERQDAEDEELFEPLSMKRYELERG